MFTGLVEAQGKVKTINRGRLWLTCPAQFASLAVGDSLAVDGVCLTVEEKKPGREPSLAFQLGQTTLQETNLGDLRVGQAVNLERPLTLERPLGGHLVSGHVDGVITLKRISPGRGGQSWELELPKELDRFVVAKGSIALNGVSLTVSGMTSGSFSVFLIPQTLKTTCLGSKKAGDRLNLEVDLLAKYLAKQAAAQGEVKLPQSGASAKIIDPEFLRQAGF